MRLTDGRRRPFGFQSLHVERDGNGRHVLRDSEGVDPFKHPDLEVRLRWLYLFAQADELRALVKEMAHYLESKDDGYGFVNKLTAAAWATVVEASPPQSEVEAARSRQTEVDWGAA